MRGWIPLVTFPLAVALLSPAAWPRWALMWALAISMFAGCKWLTWRRSNATYAAFWRHAAYLIAWPGLDADAFLGEKTTKKPSVTEWLMAAAKLAVGMAILWTAVPALDGRPGYLRGWVGMLGLAFVLHFGLFNVLSCLWRSAGVNARPIMDIPIASASVSEFWSRRWNAAFRDLTHRFLFLPLVTRIGPRTAVVATFLFSGLVHDAVISLPAGGGYGGPTAYFLIQALGIFAERGRIGRRLRLRRRFVGRVFTWAVIVGPAPLLFHPPFVTKVIVPFLEFLIAAR
ncbi:MAG: membrane bound O-acyl transferase family-domain-containing protein [Planctomycetota bacterium]|nr:hypothetical protein [Planctomycetaceae bacterium]MDQ3332744.1 membrane bound O-acyl transferase family-domain-containing protein [Planctomycetota bacterium]